MLRATFTGAVSRVAVRSAAPAVRPMAIGKFNILNFCFIGKININIWTLYSYG